VGRAYSIDSETPQVSAQKVLADLPLPVHGVADRAAIGITIAEHASYASAATYSERAAAYVAAGWSRDALETTSPWAAASVVGAHEEVVARAAAGAGVTVTASWRLARCTLNLPLADQRKVNPAFAHAVERALAQPDARERLRQVFRRWGHVLPTTIVLGAAKRATKRFDGGSPVRALSSASVVLVWQLTGRRKLPYRKTRRETFRRWRRSSRTGSSARAPTRW
jgi:hypothetical protein